MKEKNTIGRAEFVNFPGLGLTGVNARIDTGAQTSAIWASKIKETDKGLEVVFFGPSSKHYTNQTVIFDNYELTVVSSSTGHTEVRFKIRLLVVLEGRTIKARFTLANRKKQVYPVLIGRNILLNKFIVDVSQGGGVLPSHEREKTTRIRSEFKERIKS